MKSPEWKTYRTRFLIKAKQLTSALSFTDHLGRQHCGRRGDYLVESFDGVLSIAPRQIFEDIYVSMLPAETASPDSSQNEINSQPNNSLKLGELRIEPLKIETVRSRFHAKVGYPLQPESNGSSRVRRKSPQPVRETSPRISLM